MIEKERREKKTKTGKRIEKERKGKQGRGENRKEKRGERNRRERDSLLTLSIMVLRREINIKRLPVHAGQEHKQNLYYNII